MEQLPNDVALFDALPDAAFVRLPTVMAIFAISEPTAWRWIKSGRLPRPMKLSERVTCWRVADLRRKLAELQAQAA